MHDRGELVVNEHGDYPRERAARDLRLPDFHAMRHGAALDCDDAKEARMEAAGYGKLTDRGSDA